MYAVVSMRPGIAMSCSSRSRQLSRYARVRVICSRTAASSTGIPCGARPRRSSRTDCCCGTRCSRPSVRNTVSACCSSGRLTATASRADRGAAGRFSAARGAGRSVDAGLSQCRNHRRVAVAQRQARVPRSCRTPRSRSALMPSTRRSLGRRGCPQCVGCRLGAAVEQHAHAG